MSSSPRPSETASLHAIYTSSQQPTTSHTFEHELSFPSTRNAAAADVSSTPEQVRAKTKYLAELRGKVSQLQIEINTFLTQKMEEDKKAAEAHGQKVSEIEAKEEENYGEEVLDGEDA